jgi:hypothetical protein
MSLSVTLLIIYIFVWFCSCFTFITILIDYIEDNQSSHKQKHEAALHVVYTFVWPAFLLYILTEFIIRFVKFVPMFFTCLFRKK